MAFSVDDIGSSAFNEALDRHITGNWGEDSVSDDMSDDEYADLMQAAQEALDPAEVDRMFEWWEKQ